MKKRSWLFKVIGISVASLALTASPPPREVEAFSLKKLTKKVERWVKRPRITIRHNGKKLLELKTTKPELRVAQGICIYATGGDVQRCAPDVIQKNVGRVIKKLPEEQRDLMRFGLETCKVFKGEVCSPEWVNTALETQQSQDQQIDERATGVKADEFVQECSCRELTTPFGYAFSEARCASGQAVPVSCYGECPNLTYSWTTMCVASEWKGFPDGAATVPCGCYGQPMVEPGQRISDGSCASGFAAPELCDGGCTQGGAPWTLVCTKQP